MANKKISELTAASAAALANEFAINEAGASKKVSLTQIRTLIGDGLTHGDALSIADPAYILLRDEFVAPINTTAGSLLPGVGSLNWVIGNNTGGAGAIRSDKGITPNGNGEVSWQNSTTSGLTAGQGTGLMMLTPLIGAAPSRFAWPLLSNPGWKLTFVWRFSVIDNNASSGPAINFLKKSFYIGLGFNVGTITAGWSRPPIFIGCRFDKDTTSPSIADSTFKLEAVQNLSPLATVTRNNTQGTVVDTLVTPAQNVYYRLDITCTAIGVVTMSLNGSAPSTFNLTQFTYTGSGSDTAVAAGFGTALITAQSGSVGACPFGPGETAVIAGLTGASAPLNGTHIITNTGTTAAATRLEFDSAEAGINTATNVGWTAVGYPSLIPIVLFGNNTEVTPAADCRIFVDYFSFIWNKGTITGGATTDSTKPRYWVSTLQ